jgi:acid phosphatase type 7
MIAKEKPYWAGGLGLLIGLLTGLFVADITGLQITNSNKTHSQKPKTIVIAGDISCEPGEAKTMFSCRSDETASVIAALQPDAVLTAGDNQYPTGALSDYQDAYDKTWGRFKDITYPTPGNHEYQTPDAAGYFDYFGDRAGARGKGYYSFLLGNWRLIALNSEIDVSADSEQLAWLRHVLQTNQAACTLAYWHKPRFSTIGHASDVTLDSLWRLLYAHGVDVVVNGHSHGYERYLPQNPNGQPDPNQGIVQFISGLGGRSIQLLRASTPTTLASRQNQTFGVIELMLYPRSAVYRFVPINSTQTFTDRGSITCH